MKEVAGAVIATSLVLVAVFVPVALFPGTTGILFRQFALTIAFSVSISAFNALTLTPALSAIFLGHHRERAQGCFFRAFNRVSTGPRMRTAATVTAVIGWRAPALVAFLAVLGCTYLVYQTVPRAFIPEDDQGYIMFIDAGAAGRFADVHARHLRQGGSRCCRKCRKSTARSRVAGFSFSGQRAQPRHHLLQR